MKFIIKNAKFTLTFMNKKILSSIIIFFFVIFAFTSCKNNKKSSNNTISNIDSLEINENTIRKLGEIPYNFPTVTTTAKTGEYVLAPSFSFIEDAWTGESSSFNFHSRKCLEVGKVESKLYEIGEEVMIPNSLIIPIPAGETAAEGDIVLTWWQSGSGMCRAIIVDATNSKSPIAKYLDIDFDNPTTNKNGVPIGQMDEQLEPNSFTKITSTWQAGTSIAVLENGNYSHYKIIRIENNKVLASGWAGKLAVFQKSDCIAIPIQLELVAGDKVQVPYIGNFIEGVVKKYDKKIGRVFVEIIFAGQKNNIVTSIGNVALELEIL